ncbi:testis-specific Y-encoded protein 2-like [Talpa occidentalis]|uniref:testis-specific Y-encoded protein 2-like n=1 Tax=Talpa occidentalis TaxID=50954 RepID=UPI00188FF387|nr:testis-specific Y-encoded protein 2-like [Talpa occidentalis]
MEGAARPGPGGAPGGPSAVGPVLASGPEEAAAAGHLGQRAPQGGLSQRGPVADGPPGDGAQEQAAIFGQAGGRAAEAGPQGAQAGSGEGLLLVPGDALEVVAEEEVTLDSDGEDGDPGEGAGLALAAAVASGGGQPGPAPAVTAPSVLEALQALQLELEPVNRQASRAYCRLKLRMRQRRQPHLDRRGTIIQGVRGFWAKAFVNHPQMSAWLSDEDEDMLGYMINLKVEEHRDCCRISLLFRNNPYFQNDVVIKEYLVHITGYRPSHSTRIQWHQAYQREAYSRRHDNSSLNFFNWFSDHHFAGSSRIAEIICQDLWPDPLQYYLRRKVQGERIVRRRGKTQSHAKDGATAGEDVRSGGFCYTGHQ